MSARNMESFLARLYIDSDLRARFKAAPRPTAEKAGLAAEEVRSVEKLDLAGLELTSRSFAAKRRQETEKRFRFHPANCASFPYGSASPIPQKRLTRNFPVFFAFPHLGG